MHAQFTQPRQMYSAGVVIKVWKHDQLRATKKFYAANVHVMYIGSLGKHAHAHEHAHTHTHTHHPESSQTPTHTNMKHLKTNTDTHTQITFS